MRPICQHCRKSAVNRPRGLCWTCYYAPGVRDMYPSTSKYARRGEGNFNGTLSMPLLPTTAAPGTPEKVAVLVERVRNRQSLFHPADAQYVDDPRPVNFLRKNSLTPAYSSQVATPERTEVAA